MGGKHFDYDSFSHTQLTGFSMLDVSRSCGIKVKMLLKHALKAAEATFQTIFFETGSRLQYTNVPV